jgi:hypothetical protein
MDPRNLRLCGGLTLAGLVIACSSGSSAGNPFAPNSNAGFYNAQELRKSIRWSSVGPTLRHGNAGKLNAFAYVQSNPEIMFVAGGWGNTPRESPSQAGIFRTDDGGRHWAPADNGLTNPDGTISSVVNGLWIDQSNPSIVLAATEFGGTFRSIDGGASWKNIDRAESTQFAQLGSALYLATRRGVLMSTDEGATWQVSLADGAGATSVVTAGGATFAGDAAGYVYRLSGAAWLLVGHVGTGAVHDLAVDPFNTDTVYANVDDIDAWNQHLYGSLNGGKTWLRIICPCAVGAQAIAFSNVVPDRLYLGDDGSRAILYFPADGRHRPKMYPGGATKENDVRYIIPVAQNGSSQESCYLLTDQGLFYDASCTSGPAVGLTHEMANFLAYDVTLPPNARNIVVPLQDWNAVAGSTGGKLHFLKAEEGGESFMNPYNPSSCYLAHPDEGIYISSDGCATFSGPHAHGIESLAFEPPNGRTMYAIMRDDRKFARVSISTDGGLTWRRAFREFQNPYQVVVSPRQPKFMLVATGTASTSNDVFATHDGGATWQESTGLPQSTPLIEQYFPAHQFYAAFDPSVPNTVLLADHDPVTNNVLVFRSVNGGLTFILASTLVQPPTQRPWPDFQLPPDDGHLDRHARYYATRFYANRLAFEGQAPSGCKPSVVLTTRFGAFQSFDTGNSWSRIDTSAIPHHFIGVTWVNRILYLASFGGGVIASADPGAC